MNAEFQWWLLIFGIVIGGALVYLVMADLRTDDQDDENDGDDPERDPDPDLVPEPADLHDPAPVPASRPDATLNDDDPSSPIEPRSAP